jgi:hypothetical protein
MWKRGSFVSPFLASASFSMSLGSCRVKVFKFESAVAGGEVISAGIKNLCSLSASTGKRSESTMEKRPYGPEMMGKDLDWSK